MPATLDENPLEKNSSAETPGETYPRGKSSPISAFKVKKENLLFSCRCEFKLVHLHQTQVEMEMVSNSHFSSNDIKISNQQSPLVSGILRFECFARYVSCSNPEIRLKSQ